MDIGGTPKRELSRHGLPRMPRQDGSRPCGEAAVDRQQHGRHKTHMLKCEAINRGRINVQVWHTRSRTCQVRCRPRSGPPKPHARLLPGQPLYCIIEHDGFSHPSNALILYRRMSQPRKGTNDGYRQATRAVPCRTIRTAPARAVTRPHHIVGRVTAHGRNR